MQPPKLAFASVGLFAGMLSVCLAPAQVAGDAKEPVPRAPGASPEKPETFEFFQDGKMGQGVRRVRSVDLGQGATLELVRIPAGRFQMGSPPTQKGRGADEGRHAVEISRDFYLGKCEVTRRQFGAFVSATGYRTEPETDGQGGWGFNATTGAIEGRQPRYSWRFTGTTPDDDEPVTNITWNDADAFCRWLARRTNRPVRLPTEAEWEYACRAGSSARFYSGDDAAALNRIGNFADATARRQFPDWRSPVIAPDGYVFAAPVGKFLPNRFGVHDMLGNVWEWCEDWVGPYESLATVDPVRVEPWENQMGRIMRGGGFGKRTPRICSMSQRVAGAPTSRDIDLGFRVCMRAD